METTKNLHLADTTTTSTRNKLRSYVKHTAMAILKAELHTKSEEYVNFTAPWTVFL